MIGQFINSTRFCHWVPSPLMLLLPISKIYEDENDDSGNKHIFYCIVRSPSRKVQNQTIYW